jgi:hypothetical protein
MSLVLGNIFGEARTDLAALRNLDDEPLII